MKIHGAGVAQGKRLRYSRPGRPGARGDRPINLTANPAMRPEDLFQRATDHLARRDYAAAEKDYRLLLQRVPGHGPALNNLGATLFLKGDLAGARAVFGELCQRAPADAQAHFNVARCLREEGRNGEAVDWYRAALARRADYPEAAENLANALSDLDRHGEALPLYLALIEQHPAVASNYRAAALLLRDTGRLAEARALLDRGLARLGPDAGGSLQLARLLLLPPLPASAAEIHAVRDDFREQLARLNATTEPRPAVDPLREVGSVPFFLAYHGEDDRPLNEGLATLLRRRCPQLVFTAAHVARPLRARRRIGIVTAHAGQHTTARYFDPLFAALAAHADVRLYYAGQAWAKQLQTAGVPPPVPARALPADLAAGQQALAGEELDVLIYPEVGIHPLPYFLAHARLAPVQIALYGQPVTTGIPTIDYFLSHAGSEPPVAQADYSERLLLLPATASSTCIRRRGVAPSDKRRADFGLPADRPLYLCAQSLFKIHPDFDLTLGELLRQDREGIAVLVATKNFWGDALRQRLHRQVPDVAARVRLLPYQSLADFLALTRLADVALDTPQFSGGSTSFDTLEMGTPLVTLPGRHMRARQTAGLYATMGLPNLVAQDTADYLQIARRIAHAPAERQRLSEAILAGTSRIFDDQQAAAHFCRLVLEAPPGPI